MLKIDKEYRNLILGKWVSINIDGSIPKEQQWLDFDQNIRSYDKPLQKIDPLR